MTTLSNFMIAIIFIIGFLGLSVNFSSASSPEFGDNFQSFIESYSKIPPIEKNIIVRKKPARAKRRRSNPKEKHYRKHKIRQDRDKVK